MIVQFSVRCSGKKEFSPLEMKAALEHAIRNDESCVLPEEDFVVEIVESEKSSDNMTPETHAD